MNSEKPDMVIVDDPLALELAGVETVSHPEPEPVSFADLPKARQHRALCAYAEGWRRFLATGSNRGGKSSRQMRRAQAAFARSAEGRRQAQLEKKAGQP